MKRQFMRVIALSLALEITQAPSVRSAEAAANGSPTPQLLLLGPLEGVDARGTSLRVLGQKFAVRVSKDLQTGENVSIYGFIRSDGSIAVSAAFKVGHYIPGASRVLLTGIVELVNSSTGRVRIRGVEVDLNSLEFDPSTLQPRMVVQVTGLQPNPRGAIVAEDISIPSSGASSKGTSVGSVQGSSGESVHGISGGSVQGISGESMQGISGGSVQAISGGSVQGPGQESMSQ